MKHSGNTHVALALLFATTLFGLLFQLHRQPLNLVIKTFNHAFEKGESKSHIYTNNYIAKVRRVYTLKIKQQVIMSDSLTISNDSLFVISLKQMVQNFSVNANPYPVITEERDGSLNCSFKMIAQKNFNIEIQLKHQNNEYVFNDIANLQQLLDYYPEYVTELAHQAAK